MRIITCIMQPFTIQQSVVINEDGQTKYLYTTLDEIANMVPELCFSYDSPRVRVVGGGKEFDQKIADDIMTAYSTKYSKNDMIIEVE